MPKLAATFAAETSAERTRLLADRAARQRARDRAYRARLRAARTPAEIERDRELDRKRKRAMRRRPKVSAKQALGTAHQALGAGRGIRAEAEALEKIANQRREQRGLHFSFYYELRPELRKLRGELYDLRIRLRRQIDRCRHDDPQGWSELVARRRPFQTLDEYAPAVLRGLGEGGRDVLGHTAYVDRLLNRKPDGRKYRRRPDDEALAALETWADEHGRWPTKAELTDPALPSWGTVHRRWGGLAGARKTAEREARAREAREQREQHAAAREVVDAERFKTLQDVRDAVEEHAYESEYPERRHFEDNIPAPDAIWLPTWERFVKLAGSEGRADMLLYDWWEALEVSGAFREPEAPDDPSRGQPA